MNWTVRQVADILGGEIAGNPDAALTTLAKIEEAGPGGISFLANPKYEAHLYTTQATAVLISRQQEVKAPVNCTLIRVRDPYQAFGHLLTMVQQAQTPALTGIEQPCYIHPGAQLAEDVYVGAFAWIGPDVTIGAGAKIYPHVCIGAGSVIGAQTIIYPHVTLYHGTQVGSRCIIHSGARIGADGFGFIPQPDGKLIKMPQIGVVVLEDEVEIGANTCIDRATLGETRIRRGVKLDNLVQIAHNVEIDHDTALAAQAGVAGSTRIGAHCMIGGQAGMVGHITIADQTRIDAQSGVNSSIKTPGGAYRGSPIQPYARQLRSEVIFRKLDKLEQQISELHKRLSQSGLS
ncbi:MAG: UDP-3-O-(3-hydroxymyristoyl)glucosamine N-acyltransferase [Bacteroidia bacterium]|nr:UDP-3-O-(3-hydroxymyristoyl)glucosamine N-acyltransferase [Bacteroidia bacterium]